MVVGEKMDGGGGGGMEESMRRFSEDTQKDQDVKIKREQREVRLVAL